METKHLVKETCPTCITLKLEFACKGMMDERTAWGINIWIVEGHFIRGSKGEREKDGNNKKRLLQRKQHNW